MNEAKIRILPHDKFRIIMYPSLLDVNWVKAVGELREAQGYKLLNESKGHLSKKQGREDANGRKSIRGQQ